MTTPKEITAQHFWDIFHSQVSKLTEHYLVKSGDDVVENITVGFETLISQVRQQAFSAGRLQGLMEMDGAWDFVTRTNPEECEMRDPVSVLRAEYQQPN